MRPTPRWTVLRSSAVLSAVSCALIASEPLAAHGRHDRLPQLGAAVSADFVGDCARLLNALAPLANTRWTGASTVAAGALTVAGQPVAEHCLVTGKMFERTSAVDGKSYAIGFEMRLPRRWNGRFLHQGNGGADGAVVTAVGATGGGPLSHALAKGFAVLSSDAGHSGGSLDFGIDPQARLDYGYQAVGKLTPMAKDAISIAYGKRPDRSYFAGCSNGGRHGMVAAARYFADYDGILAGAPGYNLPKAAVANLAGARLYASVATLPVTNAAELATGLSDAERALLANRVVQRCDALDGAVDGMVQNTDRCQFTFRLDRDVPTCTGARNGSCLSSEQKSVLRRIFNGTTTSSGRQIYNSFPWDGGFGAGNAPVAGGNPVGSGIAFWEFFASLNLDAGATGLVFKVPPEAPATFNPAVFSLTTSIDDLYTGIFASNGTYTESSMSFMTPPEPTRLNGLRNRGGKIIVYHGVSDAIFSVTDSEDWYRRLRGNDRGEFARLYRVPGMGHCSGGPATDQFDLLDPLVRWVERGVAPQEVLASARGAGNAGGVNADLPAGWSATRSRPLCPYPTYAQYRGRGSLEEASSFYCTTGRRGHR